MSLDEFSPLQINRRLEAVKEVVAEFEEELATNPKLFRKNLLIGRIQNRRIIIKRLEDAASLQ